jgi:hypothetical protein
MAKEPTTPQSELLPADTFPVTNAGCQWGPRSQTATDPARKLLKRMQTELLSGSELLTPFGLRFMRRRALPVR